MKDFLRRHPLIRSLLTLVCLLTALGTGAASIGIWILFFNDILSERVHEVQPFCHQPEYEGKLVKIHVRELHSEGGPAKLSNYGLSCDNVLWVRSDMRPPRPMMKRREDFHCIGSVRECIAAAPKLLSGAYELHFSHNLMEHMDCGKPICIPPSQVTLPAALADRVAEIRDTHFVMRGNDNATVHLSFSYVPSPQRVNLQLLGRQRGNRIEVTEFIRGEDAFRHLEREHSFIIFSFREHLLLALVFLMISSSLAALVYYLNTLCSCRAVLFAAAVSILLQLVPAFITPPFLHLP